MKQLGRILLNAVTVLSLLSCAVTVAIWLKARRAYPSAAWASGDKTLHLAAHSGTIWVTRTQGWSDGAGARKAAAAAPAARPVVLRPHFPSLARAMEDQRQRLIQALREMPRLGAREPGSRSCLSLGAAELEAQMTVLVEEMKTSLRDDAVARAGGPPAEPVLAEAAPTVGRALGVTVERGRVSFPARSADGVIQYGPAVAFVATGVPLWMALVPCVLVPVLRAVWRIHAYWRCLSRKRLGLCSGCGYDLRATPGRCPECGRVPPVPPIPANRVLMRRSLPFGPEPKAESRPRRLVHRLAGART